MTVRTWTPPWYDGLALPMALRTVAPTELAIDVAYVRDYVLRTANSDYEDAHIERLIRTATDMAERETGEALLPQTWQVVLSGFPTGRIVLPRPPLVSVSSIVYVDGEGDEQTLSGASPAEFLVKPSGDVALASVAPLTDESWPTARAQADAVTVTFEAGYADASEIPDRIVTGILLMVGELYKQRSLSVQNTIQNVPAVLQLERFWRPRPEWV